MILELIHRPGQLKLATLILGPHPHNPRDAVEAPPGLARHDERVPRSQQHRRRLRLSLPPAEQEHARLPQGHRHERRLQVPLRVVGVTTCRYVHS